MLFKARFASIKALDVHVIETWLPSSCTWDFCAGLEGCESPWAGYIRSEIPVSDRF